MGAQMVQPVSELIFTSAEESVVITLSDGRVIEIHGDGFMQEILENGRITETQL